MHVFLVRVKSVDLNFNTILHYFTTRNKAEAYARQYRKELLVNLDYQVSVETVEVL